MRPNNSPLLTALSVVGNQSSLAQWADMIVRASFQAVTTGTAAGTLQVQGSNDQAIGLPAGQFVPTNWSNVGSAVTVTSTPGTWLVPATEVAYEYLRLNFTSTATGVQTVAPIADTGVKKAQTVTTIADTGVKEVTDVTCAADIAGSLNSTYFNYQTRSTGGASTNNRYAWFNVDGTGVDPAPVGRVGIAVPISAGDANTVVAAALRTALAADTNVTITGGTSHCIITNRYMGTAVDAANGTASPGFSFSITQGVASNLLNTYFTLSSVNTTTKAQKNFYLWLNVNSEGTDPLIASKTAIPVAIAASATANAVATAIRSALNALTGDFVATGANAAVITTNVAFGPVTAAVDGAVPTGFTFGAVTTGVASNLNNTYFLLQDTSSANLFYIWMNVDSIGTDPAVAGRTGGAVAFSSGSSAGTIGAALATAVAALNATNSFTTSGTTTVTITNKTSGPFVPASDVSTGFTFAVTAPTGTISARMKSMAL